jgi:lipopolysaccharide export LptBFGC system permease protein LptF
MLVRLRTYILRETAKVLGLAVLGVAAVILLAICIRMLREGVKPLELRSFIVYMVPLTLPFALPSGLLIAAVMVFGRFAGDNELLAIRASGVSLWSVLWPVLGVGVALAMVAFAVNNFLLPWSQQRLVQKREELIGPYLAQLGPGMQTRDLKPYVVYIGGVNPTNAREWYWVTAVKYADDMIEQIIFAKSGTCTYDASSQTAVLTLRDGSIQRPVKGAEDSLVYFPGEVQYTIDLAAHDTGTPSMNASSLTTLLELRSTLSRELAGKRLVRNPRPLRRKLENESRKLDERIKDLLKADKQTSAQLSVLSRESSDINRSLGTLRDNRATLDSLVEARVQIIGGLDEQLAAIDEVLARSSHKSERRREYVDSRAGLQRQRNDHEAFLVQKRAELAECDTKTRGLLESLADNAARVEDLVARTASTQPEMAKANDNLQQLKGQIDTVRKQELFTDVKLQLSMRFSQSLACLVFVLLGIPLGALAGRGSVIVSFGISFAVILLLYYPPYTLGRQLAQMGYMSPSITMWIPDAVCGSIGVVLLWRALRR